VIERDGERLTIRPEKIELLDPDHAPDGIHSERGRIVEVAYAGMLTRYTVALDAGGTLQMVKQNLGDEPGEASPEQGKEVLVGWRPQHAAAVRGKTMKEEVAP
jgi:ABC-type Fe3+/spermidine/putrescine transport system ATPase subunit